MKIKFVFIKISFSYQNSSSEASIVCLQPSGCKGYARIQSNYGRLVTCPMWINSLTMINFVIEFKKLSSVSEVMLGAGNFDILLD